MRVGTGGGGGGADPDGAFVISNIPAAKSVTGSLSVSSGPTGETLYDNAGAPSVVLKPGRWLVVGSLGVQSGNMSGSVVLTNVTDSADFGMESLYNNSTTNGLNHTTPIGTITVSGANKTIRMKVKCTTRQGTWNDYASFGMGGSCIYALKISANMSTAAAEDFVQKIGDTMTGDLEIRHANGVGPKVTLNATDATNGAKFDISSTTAGHPAGVGKLAIDRNGVTKAVVDSTGVSAPMLTATTDGVKFPDGTIQTTAAPPPGTLRWIPNSTPVPDGWLKLDSKTLYDPATSGLGIPSTRYTMSVKISNGLTSIVSVGSYFYGFGPTDFYRSADGVNWTRLSSYPAPVTNVARVSGVIGTRFIALSDTTPVYCTYSDDGVTWSAPQDLGAAIGFKTMHGDPWGTTTAPSGNTGASPFIVGYARCQSSTGVNDTATIAYTTDGASWQKKDIYTNTSYANQEYYLMIRDVYLIRYNGYYVLTFKESPGQSSTAGTYNGWFYKSTDLVTWTKSSYNYCTSYGNGTTISGAFFCDSGVIVLPFLWYDSGYYNWASLYSTDGITWNSGGSYQYVQVRTYTNENVFPNPGLYLMGSSPAFPGGKGIAQGVSNIPGDSGLWVITSLSPFTRSKLTFDVDTTPTGDGIPPATKGPCVIGPNAIVWPEPYAGCVTLKWDGKRYFQVPVTPTSSLWYLAMKV